MTISTNCSAQFVVRHRSGRQVAAGPRSAAQDHLVRALRRVRVDRAQRLVPVEHVEHRRLQRVHVQRAGQPDRQRDVVRRASPGSKRLMNHIRCCASDSGTRRAAVPRRQAGARRTSASAAADAGGEAARPSAPRTAPARRCRRRRPRPSRATTRVARSEFPPRSKKLSSAPTRSTPSTSAKTRGDRLFDRRRRGTELAVRAANSGSGSALRSSLPTGGQRDRVERPRSRRHHVRRAATRRDRRRASRRVDRRARRREHVRHEGRLPGRSRGTHGRPRSRRPDARRARRRSRRVRCGTRGPSPGSRSGRRTRRVRRPRPSARRRRCGTCRSPGSPNGLATNRSAVSAGAGGSRGRAGAGEVELTRRLRPAPGAAGRRAQRLDAADRATDRDGPPAAIGSLMVT